MTKLIALLALCSVSAFSQFRIGADAVRIQGKSIAKPVAGDDQKFIRYNHSTGQFEYVAGTAGSGIAQLGVSGSQQTGTSQLFAKADDTNVTLSIGSAANTHTWTLGWTGTLAKARQNAATVYNDAGNTWSTGTQDFSSATALIAKIAAAYAPTANGSFGYNSTTNEWAFGHNGTTYRFAKTANSSVSDGCATFASGVLSSTGVACGSGGGGSISLKLENGTAQTGVTTLNLERGTWIRSYSKSFASGQADVTINAGPDEKTVATLPAASGVSGNTYLVTDSSNGGCATGGGSLKTWCRSNGTTYDPVGDGNSGGTPDLNSATGDVSTSQIENGAVTPTKASAALKTETKSFNLFDPATGDSGKMQLQLPNASTITRIGCSVNAATSATININKRAEATPDTSGTDVLSAGLVCDTNAQTSCASGCDVSTITLRL
jgi:hypothetical protein